MKRDFTVNQYKTFLEAFASAGYCFSSFEDFLRNKKPRTLILRHDVDKRPGFSVRIARLQAKMGAKGTYYFRAVPGSYDEKAIREIASLGHEIGYHYEDLSLARGDYDKALEHFQYWLEKLRAFYPVSTICMHGSPLSSWDNRSLWEKYDYRDFGISGEPYFDIDFNEVLYLTDTGRRWDGEQFAVRDKVRTRYNFRFRTTADIIEALKKGSLPDKVMQNIHPQRWTDNRLDWWKEYALQHAKNLVKKAIFVKPQQDEDQIDE